jgi:hypothetical protein
VLSTLHNAVGACGVQCIGSIPHDVIQNWRPTADRLGVLDQDIVFACADGLRHWNDNSPPSLPLTIL